MRREGAVVVALSLIGFVSCASHLPPNLTGDVVSGCDVDGSPFVKVQITLARTDGRCRATVLPEKVCVFQGGGVRFRVVDRCGDLRSDLPAVSITQPVPQAERGEKPGKKAWTFKACIGRFDSLGQGDDPKNFLTCEVPDRVVPGLYKYGLTGQIDPLDPDVEVRKGR